ncbi:MAG: DUF2157 domain-containing protein [Alphaproteobacteria bacterium]|nr:DUF2157 domain-containing protein [Alphaproteobacteria bacterium]
MFGSLIRKCKRWQEHSLISEDQVQAILAFEKQRKAGKLVRDLTNVAIFAIFLGVVSLVAANWVAIPDDLKLIGHFILNLLVVWFLLRIDQQQHPVRRDSCLLLLFGLFLTFIALIGQTYQLHGDLHTTLLFWLAICTPFIWYFGSSYMVAVPWLAVAVVALYLNIGHYLDKNEDRLVLIGSLISFYLPMALILVSRLPVLKTYRPGFIEAFYRLGIYLPAIFANIALHFFYEGPRALDQQTVLLALMALGLFVIFAVFHPRAKVSGNSPELWYYLLVSGLVMMLPFVLPELESGELSALLFVLYWMFIAWLGARIHAASLTDWAIRLVILRLFIVYLEVFGSLLQTGVGLIASGIILLVVLRYLNRIVAVGRKLVNYEIG